MSLSDSPMNALAQHVLTSVQGLEDLQKSTEDGHGAFGVVYKVTANGSPCMAKRLHQILVKEVSFEERTSMEAKFMNECVLLSRLSHPNIVHFIGVYYGRSEHDLSLIMERLYTDVAAFVRAHKKVPTSIKTSIMLDVSYGLLYLHNHTPAIIHRDLTAPNVLLTRDLRAKIADLGVSKVLSDPLLIKQTTAPGNVTYMAPETKTRNPVYGMSVDIFSAGHLIIHVSIQDWPKLFKVENHLVVAPGKMEIAERQAALDDGMGKQHCMYDLAIDCLQDDPKQRPTTSDFSKRLMKICMKNPKTFHDLCQVERCEGLTEDVESKEMISRLTEVVGRQEAQIEQLTREKNEALIEMETQKLAAQTYREDFNSEREDRQKAHSKLAELEGNYAQRLQSLTDELQDSHKRTDELHSVLSRRAEDIRQLQREKSALEQRLTTIEEGGSVTVSVPTLSTTTCTSPQQAHDLQRATSFPPQHRVDDTPGKFAQVHEQYDHARAPTPDFGYINLPEVDRLDEPVHSYVNLRDPNFNLQDQLATLATDPQYGPRTNYSHTERARSQTVSAPNAPSPTWSDAKGKTLPPKVKSQVRPNVNIQRSSQELKGKMMLPEVKNMPLESAMDSLSPLPRHRAAALSKDSIVAPLPPVRHQSLSRSRSNPDTAQKQSPYEHVPARFEQSQSLEDKTNPPAKQPQDSAVDQQPEVPDRLDSNLAEAKTISPTQYTPRSHSPQAHRPTSPRHMPPNYQFSSSQDETSSRCDKTPELLKHHRQSDPSVPMYENIELLSTPSGNRQFKIGREAVKAGQGDNQQYPVGQEKHSGYPTSMYSTLQGTSGSNDPPLRARTDQDTLQSQLYATTNVEYDPNDTLPTYGQDSIDLPPLDPYLLCQYCKTNFRVGEIQAYRTHYMECKHRSEREHSGAS